MMRESGLSDKITVGRVVMMILVVAIHCSVVGLRGYDGPAGLTAMFDFFDCYITSVAVPWFFFISAYLMASLRREGGFDAYKSTVKRRVRSILLPFVLWNTLAFLIRQGVNLSPLRSFTGGGREGFDSIWDFFLRVYFEPELEPLWFLRNLFLFTLFYPVFQRAVRVNSVVALVMFWLIEEYVFSSGLIYYGLGFVVAKWCGPEKMSGLLPRFGVMFPLVVGVMVAAYFWVDSEVCYQLLIVAGLFSLWGMACLLLPFTGGLGKPDNIFFIYAAHGIISPYVLKVSVLMFDVSGLWWAVLYVVSIVVVIGVCYGGAVVVRTLMPGVFGALTGSRRRALSAL